MRGALLAPGWYWFPTVPATATSFAVLLTQSDGGHHFTMRKVWHFSEASAARRLRISEDPLFPLRFTIVNAQGDPVRDAPVWGSLQAADSPEGYWESIGESAPVPGENPAAPLGEINVLSELRTDDAGTVELGCSPPIAMICCWAPATAWENTSPSP